MKSLRVYATLSRFSGMTYGSKIVLIGGLIALGSGLGLSVLAEGTETLAEVEFLRACGCHLFQGYYFSRPVPAEVIQGRFIELSQLKAA